MTDEMKLVLALQQVNNLTSLMKGNEWEGFISSRLMSIQCELERQLTILQHSSKIEVVQNS